MFFLNKRFSSCFVMKRKRFHCSGPDCVDSRGFKHERQEIATHMLRKTQSDVLCTGRIQYGKIRKSSFIRRPVFYERIEYFFA